MMVLSKVVICQPDEAASSCCADKPYKHGYIAEVLTMLEADENPCEDDPMTFVCLHVRHHGPQPRPPLPAVMSSAHKPAAEK
jgi:hypothetical protein